MKNKVRDPRFKLIEDKDNYKLFKYNTYYKIHLTSVYYWVEGNKENVLARIEEEKNSYHPCGYGTRFNLVHENVDENTVIYDGYRSATCE